MSERFRTLEHRIEQALDAIADGDYTFAAPAAIAFGIPPRTLQRRLASTHTSLFDRQPHGYKLTLEQRDSIVAYLTRLDKLAISARLRHLRGAANFLLAQANPVDLPRVGQHWPARFLAQNPQFYRRKQAPLAIERKNSLTVEGIRLHFRKFREAQDEYGIQPEDTWNMDESGFRIGVGRGHTVITLIPKGALRIVDPGVRDLISDVEAISAGGCSIPPMLIVPGVNILNKWVEENDLADDIVLATTDTGYSDDIKAFEWLKHFDVHSQKSQKGGFRMLIMDNYGSHLTYEFLQYADLHNIIIFTLPPHSTHVTQPLDVGIFQPMKHYHSEVIDEVIRLGAVNFNKQDFFASFMSLRAKAFTESNILSAWKHTGFFPFAPKIVMEKIRLTQPVSPSRSPQRDPFASSSPVIGTPHGASEVIKAGKDLQDHLDDQEIPEETREDFNRFIKGSIEAAHSLALAERDIQATHDHSKLKAKRDKLAGSVAQKGGVITVSQARGRIRAFVEEERVKEKRKEERIKKVDVNAREKWNKACAKGFKLTGKKAQEWINNWAELLEQEYLDGATSEEFIGLLS